MTAPRSMPTADFTNPWHDPRSYAPNLNDQLAANVRRRASRHYQREARKAVVRKFIAEHGLAVALGAVCGLVTGMLGTVGVASIWAMFL